MPLLKVDKVLTFSTEDPHHPATNLLSSDPAKKWKCAHAGEKNASVVFQLEKATQITGIDIGNEGSAYVEVLASRSSSDEYKVLLGMSSFMTPFEARQNQNINKVRMFTIDDFSEPECLEKWDRIKIVCIQPYNKHNQYGLSFVSIHTNEGATFGDKKNVGKYTLRPDSPIAFSVGSLFSREKEALQAVPLKGAAAIREASLKPSPSNYKSPMLKNPTKPSTSKDMDDNHSIASRNRHELLYTEDDDAPNKKIDKLIEKKKNEDEEKRKTQDEDRKSKKVRSPKNGDALESKKRKTDAKLTEDKTWKKPKSDDVTKDDSSVIAGPSRRNKRHSTDENDAPNFSPTKKAKRTGKAHVCKPYEKLLDGVVLVLSGVQNPERANLRTTALAMGAKYKADWDNTCTHLICAFANTPKFNQVRGKGKIVKKQWIIECDKNRKRLPWRRFALDRADKTGLESEDEIWEQVDVGLWNRNDDGDEQADQAAASDTDEEIERIQRTVDEDAGGGDDRQEENVKELAIKNDKKPEGNGIVDLDSENDGDLPVLPNYFSAMSFYLSSNLGRMKKELMKYIVAYDGELIDNFEDIHGKVIAIVYSDDEDEAKQLKTRTKTLVSPTWLLECHNKKCYLPFDNYLL